MTRAAALTHQLFAFSRKQLTEPIVLDPNSAIVRHGIVHAEIALLDKPYSVNRLAGKVLQVLDAA